MIEFLNKNGIFYERNASLKKLSSFRIGGEADTVIYPSSADQVSMLVRFFSSSNIQYLVLGNGSNILFPDGEFSIPIIKTDKMDSVTVSGNKMTVGAGCLNSKVAMTAYENSLSGFEFAHGIPGSIGGAVRMNAGAYGEEMSGVTKSVVYVDESGKINTVCEMGFGYRKSIFTDKDIVCEASLELQSGEPEMIMEKMKDLRNRRKSSQPLEYPSAGSVFKRPEGYFVGKMIQDSGLKGFSVGGAQISEKHAGFIINTGDATSKDVRDLIAYIQKVIFENYGVKLETEIKILV